MAKILEGALVTASLNESMKKDVEELKSHGILPTLCIIRVGEEADDLAYERNAVKRCEKVGVATRLVALPRNIEQASFDRALMAANGDNSIHGILMFRPLPAQLDSEKARHMLFPAKDVDGCTDGSLAGVFAGHEVGFPPCTAAAVLEILHSFDIPVAGKKAAIIGRSLVVGKPAAMMLMKEDATVTVCHTKTRDIDKICREADIIISAAGSKYFVDENFVRPGQTVIDVGINYDDETNRICGDVDFEAAAEVVDAITPVPGGVGSVTTGILVRNVITAAKRSCGL